MDDGRIAVRLDITVERMRAQIMQFILAQQGDIDMQLRAALAAELTDEHFANTIRDEVRRGCEVLIRDAVNQALKHGNAADMLAEVIRKSIAEAIK